MSLDTKLEKEGEQLYPRDDLDKLLARENYVCVGRTYSDPDRIFVSDDVALVAMPKSSRSIPLTNGETYIYADWLEFQRKWSNKESDPSIEASILPQMVIEKERAMDQLTNMTHQLLQAGFVVMVRMLPNDNVGVYIFISRLADRQESKEAGNPDQDVLQETFRRTLAVLFTQNQ